MKQLSSKIENETFSLHDLEKKLKPLGYVIGGNWDYDHGYFDYKIDDEVGYQYLRLPFTAVDGELDANGATVKMGAPFVLGHKYQIGIDDNADTGMLSGSVDQFQEPEDADASIPDKTVEVGKTLIQELENVLLT